MEYALQLKYKNTELLKRWDGLFIYLKGRKRQPNGSLHIKRLVIIHMLEKKKVLQCCYLFVYIPSPWKTFTPFLFNLYTRGSTAAKFLVRDTYLADESYFVIVKKNSLEFRKVFWEILLRNSGSLSPEGVVEIDWLEWGFNIAEHFSTPLFIHPGLESWWI